MGISVSQINRDQRPLAVPYGSETINIVYKPSAWTPAIEQDWAEAEGSDLMLEDLCKIVISWDIYEDDEGKNLLPLTPESLRQLPSAISMSFISAISEDQMPGKGSRTSSSGRSRHRN